MLEPAEVSLSLLQIAREATDLVSWRQNALAELGRFVPFRVGMFHEFSPRVSITRAATVGIEADCVALNMKDWDEMAVSFGGLLADALAHGGVGSPRRAFAPKSAAYRAWRRRVAGPMGLKDLAALHNVVGGRVISAVLLGRGRRERYYTDDELHQLERIVPALAVADGMLQSNPTAHGMQTALRCVDLRLTERQREILEAVALGHTNNDIAQALGLSPNTVRNHLVNIATKLQVSSRAEMVYRAVFR